MSFNIKDISGNAPLFVQLAGEDEPLPPGEYIRVVAQSGAPKGMVTRYDFALHNRGARFCRLLDALLDAVDVGINCPPVIANGSVPPVTLPQATKEGCLCVFHYLELIQTRVPTLISKPLRAPLEDLAQPWEMKFLVEECFAGKGKSESAMKSTANFCKTLVSAGPESMDRVLEVAMLSDFLLIESLRDLTCAFIASIGLSVGGESDLLQLCGLPHALSEEELQPLYAQLPFLRPVDDT